MKNKIEEIDEILIGYEDWMHGIDGKNCTKVRKLLREIEAIHQQATREEKKKLKGILQSIQASLDLEGAMIDNSSSIVCANVADIAKENNIKL